VLLLQQHAAPISGDQVVFGFKPLFSWFSSPCY